MFECKVARGVDSLFLEIPVFPRETPPVGLEKKVTEALQHLTGKTPDVSLAPTASARASLLYVNVPCTCEAKAVLNKCKDLITAAGADHAHVVNWNPSPSARMR